MSRTQEHRANRANVGNGNVSAMQKFISSGPWDHEEIQDDLQHVFAKELVPPRQAGRSESLACRREWFYQEGRQERGSPGNTMVAWARRQLPGRGLSHGSHTRGNGLACHQLYLPEHWCKQTAESKERRNAAHIPLESSSDKPEIAADLIRTVAVLDAVRLDWITADELYGRNCQFLDALEELDHKYVVEVPVTTNVWTTDPTLPAAAYCGGVRTPSDLHRLVDFGEGGCEELARRRLADAPGRAGGQGTLGVRIRRGSDLAEAARQTRPSGLVDDQAIARSKPEIKYYVSNASESTPMEILARVACSRCRVEEFFEDSKGYLGMARTRPDHGRVGTTT